MKKITPLLLLVLIFSASLCYLHQKIQIFVEAYRLSTNYTRYNELVAKRDYLLYNLNKHLTLEKINQWAQNQNYQVVTPDMVLAVRITKEQPAASNRFAALLNRFLGASTSSATALAGEKQ